jgi:hypothetical protein
MALYTMYWPDWMCAAAREQGLEGLGLHAVWGGHNHETSFSKFKIGPGDVLVPITVVGGALHALASLEVREKTTGPIWLSKHPEQARTRLSGCGQEVLGGEPGAVLRFDRVFTSAQVNAWRYDGSAGERAIKYVVKGKLKRTMSVTGVYRVSEATAEVVRAVLAAAGDEVPTRTVELERRLRETPDDEASARVLSDVLQEDGDPRGEVMALELAIAHEPGVDRATSLDLSHAKLMRSRVGLKKRSGGYPFRSVMGARGFTRVSAAFRIDAEPFVALARRVLVSEGINRLEVHQRGLRVDEVMHELGAQREGVVWRRDQAFTVEELRPLLARDAPISLVIEGPVRTSDLGGPLPFQHPSQWTGTPPTSSMELLLGSTARVRVQFPDGSALGARRLREVAERLHGLRSSPIVERFVRSARGDRPLA